MLVEIDLRKRTISLWAFLLLFILIGRFTQYGYSKHNLFRCLVPRTTPKQLRNQDQRIALSHEEYLEVSIR